MPLELRDYQVKLYEKAKELRKQGAKSFLFQSPTGSGKTVLAATLLKTCADKGFTAWFLVHRREILRQSLLKLTEAGVPAGIVAAGLPTNTMAPVQVCSIGTLVRRHFKLPKPQLIVYDECFVAGTPVDGMPIEQRRVGEFVRSFDTERSMWCKRKVARTMRKKPSHKYLLEIIIGGRRAICTPNHKFWTNGGWVKAESVSCGTMVMCATNGHIYGKKEHNQDRRLLDLPEMRNGKANSEREILQSVSVATSSSASRDGMYGMWPQFDHLREKGDRIQTDTTDILLAYLHERVEIEELQQAYGNNESEVRIGKDEDQKSDALRRESGEAEDNITGDGLEAAGPWWERHGADRPATSFSVRACVGDGNCSSDEYVALHRISYRLQVGHSEPETHGRDRSGWHEPSDVTPKEAGREERQVSNWSRVDRITVHEQTGDGTFGGVCPDGFVYNLEIEGTHTYTVDDIVVSNCHHISSASWSSIHEAYPDACHIGLSATPQRLDGQGLGRFFEHLIPGPTVRGLIDEGWLSPYRLFAPIRPDMTGVETVAGDYNKKQMIQRMNQSAVVGNTVGHYQKYVPGKRAIVFMWSVESSIDMAARFNQAGIPAAHIDGGTDDRTRDQAITQFRDGRILVLTNVDIVSEGFDLPSCEAGFFARPTQSLTLHLQQMGRIFRPETGKTAWLFDQCGNTRRLGLPDDEHDWSLETTAKQRKKKTEEDAVRVCPKCNEVSGMHVRVCPCGYMLIQVREMDVDEHGELSELDVRLMRRERLREQGQAKDIEGLIRFGRSKGYKNPEAWARIVMKARQEKAMRRAEQAFLARKEESVTIDKEKEWLF